MSVTFLREQRKMGFPRPYAQIMTDQQPEKLDASYKNRLNPEDQARVDKFIERGVNSVERKPFRPLRLLLILIAVVTSLSLFSQFLTRWAGIY